MNRIKQLIVLLIFILAIGCSSLAVGVSEEIIIEKNDKLNKDLFLFEKDINNKGIIGCDLFLLGGSLDNEGEIKGDILGTGPNIRLSGISKGDMRVWANDIYIEGEVFRSITTFTNDFILAEGGVVDGSLTIFGDTVEINGMIGSDIRGVVDKLVINGIIKGDVNVTAKDIIFGPNGKISGELNYKAEKELRIPMHKIGGNVSFEEEDLVFDKAKITRCIKIIKIAAKTIVYINLLALMLVLIHIYPKETEKLQAILNENIRESATKGSLILIFSTLAVVLLLVSIVAIPIGMLLLSILMILIYLSNIPIAIWIGNRLIKEKTTPMVKGFIGMSIIALLSFVPYINMILRTSITILGFGAIYYYLKPLYCKYSH